MEYLGMFCIISFFYGIVTLIAHASEIDKSLTRLYLINYIIGIVGLIAAVVVVLVFLSLEWIFKTSKLGQWLNSPIVKNKH